MARGLSSVKAETLILPEWEDAGEEGYADLLELAKQAGVSVFAGEGDRLSFQDVEMSFLAAGKASGADANEEGLVMESLQGVPGTFYRRYREKTEREFIKKGLLSDVDFQSGAPWLQIFHLEEFLEIVSRKLAVISC